MLTMCFVVLVLGISNEGSSGVPGTLKVAAADERTGGGGAAGGDTGGGPPTCIAIGVSTRSREVSG